MKFLKTIRFDPSDQNVFERAAGPDEWAIPGGFAFAHLAPDAIKGQARQAFANGFLSLSSFGRSTFATVAEIDEAGYGELTEALADHIQADYAAPNRNAALDAAEGELDFVAGLCRDVAVNTVFTLRRTHDENDEIREEFRTLKAPQDTAHTKVWAIVDDDTEAEASE